jgi:hypothetical protein
VLALAEIGVALALAFFVLGDRLTPAQVVGVGFLTVSILLIRPSDILPRGMNPNRLISNLADVQFQWIAFDQAFGRPSDVVGEDDRPTSPKLSPDELHRLRSMLGASSKPVNPISTRKDDYGHIPPSGKTDEE